MAFCLDRVLAAQRTYAIRRAADGDNHALDYLLRDFIRVAKRGKGLDPELAREAANVLERVLAGEATGEILGWRELRFCSCIYAGAPKASAAATLA